jgi:hypothetical protein
VQWVTRYWQGLETLPEGFRRTPANVHTTILENAASIQLRDDGVAQATCLQGTQVYAADDGVIVVMDPIPGRLGQTIGLAHFSRRQESSLYVGVMPDVGLGQIVHKGGTIGSTDISSFAFSVIQRPIPTSNGSRVGLGWWFGAYNVSMAP